MNTSGDAFAKPSDRDYSAVVLLCIVLVFAIVNSVLQVWSSTKSNDYLASLSFGVLLIQPLSLGMWTALGAGSMLTRLPIALPCLMLVLVAPGCVPNAFADLQRADFIASVVDGFAEFVAATAIFLIFRKFSGLRLQTIAERHGHNPRCRFSTKYLLALTTVYGIALGLTLQLQFSATSRHRRYFADLYMAVLTCGVSVPATQLLLVPTLAVPLLILNGCPRRPNVLWPIMLWVTATLAVAVFLMAIVPSTDDWMSTVQGMLVAQCGAALVAGSAATCLRIAGLRLVRYG